MNELHLFAGAGGGILGGILLGHTCVCAVEIEPYCRKVLLQRQRDGILPKFPIWDDVRTFDGKPWRGKIDVICGGFPCQDISVAGNGAGIDGERSGLWSEMARIIGEVRPRFAFVENSPMLTLRGLGRVLGDLAGMGFNARWGMFRASQVGCIHMRERVFIHANARKNSYSGKTNRRIPVAAKYRRLDSQDRENWSERFDKLGAMDVIERVSSYSEGRRVFYELADGMDRLAAIGNGQVPNVVLLAWRTLMNDFCPKPVESSHAEGVLELA